jgi:hypothetical protein
MGLDEDRGVERRLLPPPSLSLVVGPDGPAALPKAQRKLAAGSALSLETLTFLGGVPVAGHGQDLSV